MASSSDPTSLCRPPSKEVHNNLYRNLLRGIIMPPRDVDPNLLEARLLHCCRQLRIFPSPLPFGLWVPLGETLRKPVMEAAQGLLHMGGKDPRLCHGNQYRLKDRLKE